MTILKRKHITYFIRLTAVLLSTVLLLCGTDFSAVAASYSSGSITADEPDIPVGGISIDVYGSRLKYTSNGLKRYEHYYSCTVTTDSNGSFSFLRPSDKTLLKVDLNTLPAGFGINEQTRLVSAGYSDPFMVSRIDDIRILKNSDGSVYKVNLTAADGSVLFAPYDVTDHVTSDMTDISYDTLNSVKLFRTIGVNTSGISKSKTFELDISHCTVSGKLSRLLSYGIINDDDVQALTEEYKTDTATDDDPRPDFVNERTYITGNFMLHSEQETVNVEQYERILTEIVDVFFRKYDFLEPYHEYVSGSATTREPYFHIYLIDPDVIRVDSAVSPKNIVGRTIRVDPSDMTKGCYIVLSPAELVNFKWALAHELFHSIMFRYIGKSPAAWFGEAFANYGSLLCMNESVKAVNNHISYYLKSTDYPFSSSSAYRYRQYGVVLMPLYIHNKLGGVNTIKNIFKAYTGVSSAYKAIDKGLKATNSKYSFADMYSGFKDMNSYSAFYRAYGVSSKIGKTNALRTMSASFGNYVTTSTPQMTLAGNSSAYFEFNAPSSATGTLTVTVDTSKGKSNASYNLVLYGKKITIPPRRTSAKLITFELTGFGGKVTSAVLTAGNTSMSSSSEIGFIATAHFEED